MVLGLDISTSITGATIIKDNKIVYLESWDFRNKRYFPDVYTKAAFVLGKLRDLKADYDIRQIYIEKSLQMFRSGFSSAKTLSTLSSFNGVVSYLCYQELGIKPEYISASSARKACGIKVPKGQKAKEVVLNFLLDTEPDFHVEYTKHGNPKPDTYDRADSIIIAKAGYKLCLEKKS